MPAATGMRLSIVSRCGGAVPAGGLAERARARGRRGSAPSTPGQTTSSAPPRAARASARRRARRLDDARRAGAGRPARGGADEQAEVDLARARASRRRSRERLAQRAPVARARASRRARRRGGRAPPAPRARGRGSPGRARRERERARRAPCAGARSRCWTSARSAGARRRAAAPQADEHGVDVRHRDGRRCARPGAARARRRRAGRAPTARRRRGVPGRGGEPLADLPLHHRHPASSTLGSSSIVRRITRRGDAVGQVGDDLGRRRVERREVELDRVGEVQRRVRVRVERVAQRRLEPAVELDDVDVRDARRRGTRDSTPRPPPTSSTTSLGAELRGAPDHVEEVRVDEEVLAQLAVRAGCRTPAGGAGSAAPGARSPAEERARRCASTAASSSS